MRVPVTGATGLVGGALCPLLLAAGHEVIAAVRDLGSPKTPDGVTPRLVPDIGPDTDRPDALAGLDSLPARTAPSARRSTAPLTRTVPTTSRSAASSGLSAAGCRPPLRNLMRLGPSFIRPVIAARSSEPFSGRRTAQASVSSAPEKAMASPSHRMIDLTPG